MQYFNTPFTLDRVVRGAIFVAVVVALVLLLQYLAPILFPFMLAWAFAWVLVPIVNFIDHRLHFPGRGISIFAALVFVVCVFAGVVAAIAPVFTEGFEQLSSGVQALIKGDSKLQLPLWVQQLINEYSATLQIDELFSHDNVMNVVRAAGPRVWSVLMSTANIIMGLTSLFFGILYLFFILKDYETFSTGWANFVPCGQRSFLRGLAHDLSFNMRAYLRGQSLVALSNIVMFCVGFWIIGLKMWLAMGIFVGMISFIPYIQIAGFIPATVLALIEMAQGGRPFWLVLLLVALVYVVVQVIQDAVVTPRVMGKIMGLSPAIVLLALMMWGYIGGMLGLIVALPLTTTLIAYYKHYIIGDDANASDEGSCGLLSYHSLVNKKENSTKTL